MKYHPNRIFIAAGMMVALVAVWLQRAEIVPSKPFPILARAEAAAPAPAPDLTATLPPAPRSRVIAGAATQAPAEHPALERFDQWSARYLAASGADRAALVGEGRELAAARRVVLAEMIRTDPRAALAAAVPMVVRQQLPPEIVALLEERVAGRGELALNGTTPIAGQAARETSFRSALVGDREYRAHVFGRRDIPGTIERTSMNGIALDGHFAVAESPVRVLEPGELAAGRPINEVCDVSGTTTPTAADTPLNAAGAPTAIEYDGAIHILCGSNHLAAAESRLIARESDNIQNGAAGGPGGSGVSGRPDISWAQGAKKLLIIRVDFSDRPGTPVNYTGNAITEDYVASVTRSVQDFYADNSFGKTSLILGAAVGGDSPDVTPVLRLPQPGTYYDGRMDGVDRSGFLHQDARNAAELAGFNVSGYDRVGVVFSGLNYWWAGLGNISGRNFWINANYDLRVVAHEIGHNYGLWHANYWQTPYPYDQPVSPAGNSVEYGDAMDVMGSGSYSNYHFSHWNKNMLQWIPDSAVTTVETSGTYRVHRLDAGSANLALPRALKLRFDANRDYWIGYRGNMPMGTAANGAYVLWGYNQNTQGNLLNVSRRSSNTTYDAPLPVGESFTDPVNGITIRTVAQGGSGADQWLDVQFIFPAGVRWAQTEEYIAGEQEGLARLRVQRYGDTAGAITINYATAGGAAVDGRATGGQDYVETAGTVSWAAGDTADKFITIPLISDNLWEGGERFTVTLSGTASATITGQPVATVAILDAGIRDFSFRPDTPWGRVFRISVQPDDTLVIGGPFQQVYDQNWQAQTRGAIAQLSPEGRVLPEFSNGASGTDGIVRALDRQPGGRIIVGGSFAYMGNEPHGNVARLNADGTIDSSFSAYTNGPVWAAVVQPDGGILLGGSFTSVNGVPREYVARLNADGTLDPAFNGPDFDGSGGIGVKALALQPDGRVLVGGSFTSWDFQTYFRSGLCRLMPNGSRDATFVVREGAYRGSDPRGYAEVKAITVLADGRIYIAGDFNAYGSGPRGRIARLQADGSVDTSFAATIDDDVSVRCNALLPLPDGRVVLGGWFNNVNGTPAKNIAIVSATGVLDTQTAGAGGYNGEIYDFQLLANGRVQFGGDMTTFEHSSEAWTIWRMISGISNPPGTVQFAGATATGAEGANVTLTLNRTGGSGGAVSVSYAATPGTATAGDYGPATGTVTWADGDSTAKVINIALVSDGLTEGAENFTVSLGTPIGGVRLGQALASAVTIQAGEGPPPPPPPGGWQNGDIGAVGATGSSSESGGVATVSGAGADIWGTDDAFQFRHQQLTGDGAIVVRVASMGNTHPWAKVGIMFREDLTPGSREVMAFVTPGNHSGLQYRLEPGAQSGVGADVWSGLPGWLMLVRSGDTFGGYRSYDGVEWTPLGTINCHLPATAYVGLAVSSHVAGTLLTATIDNIEVTGTEPPPPPPENPPAAPDHLTTNGATSSTVSLTWRDNSSDETGFAIERSPGYGGSFAEIATVGANSQAFMDTGLTANTTYSYRVRAYRGPVYSDYSNGTLITTNIQPPSGWQGLDIGNVGPGGSETVAEPDITVRAAGADIWGTADGFRFVYKAWTGDGEIRARVASLTNTHPWAKAGVMFRESLGADARNVTFILSAANSSGLQARATTGGETSFTAGPWVTAPYWVRLVRSGNLFTAYTSPDGVAWTAQGSQTVTMTASIYVGVAVSAHTTTAMTTAVFEAVQVPDVQPPPPPPPSDWTLVNLGAAAGSFTTPADNAVTVTGSGGDIWNNSDDGQFVHRGTVGDGEFIARVERLDNTHPWAKAGIMLRDELSANSRNLFLGLTPTNGVVFQIRGRNGDPTDLVRQDWAPGVPCWLRLKRTGDSVEAAYSANGTNWTILTSIGVTNPLAAMYAGVAVSSHTSTPTTAVFTQISGPTDNPPPPPPPPPSDWQETAWSTATGSFTKTGTPGTSVTIDITATGADIWGQSDDGFYVHQVWQGNQGDGLMAVRVDSMTNTHPWAKAGLMFRETTAAASPNVFLAVTPGVGITLQVRSASGAVTTEAQHSWAAGVPCYLRLSRNFDRTFKAEFSPNGTNWTTLAIISDPLSRAMNIYGGVAVSSHTGAAITVRFTGVSMEWAI